MWDLTKSLFGAIFDILMAIIGFAWDVIVWIITQVVDVAIWIFKNVITLFFSVLTDLITNFPLSFAISIAILGIGYYIIDQWQKKKGITRAGFYQNPLILFLILVPVTTLLIGVVADSGPASIVNNTINIGGNVEGGSNVQIGGSEGGLFGIPTSIWAAIIAALATISAAVIALRKSSNN